MSRSRPLDHEEKPDPVTGMEHMKLRDPSDNDVFWHNTIASVPHQYPTLILGHEFLKEHVDWVEDDAAPAPEPSPTREPTFKEILCPHNNLAATAMLGGLFEGETVEPVSSAAESGRAAERI